MYYQYIIVEKDLNQMYIFLKNNLIIPIVCCLMKTNIIKSIFYIYYLLQLSLQEWDIPWDELNMCDKLGEGHFGTVYSGNWHGPVAIKVINMDYLDYEKTLEAFKAEVCK